MILKYFNPIFVGNLIFKILKDVDNLWFYFSKISEMKKSGSLNFHTLRVDKLNRMYTAVNIPPEFLLTTDKYELERQEKEIVGSKIIKLEKLFQDNGIFEFIKYKFKRVKTEDIYAYKITVLFKNRELNLYNVLYVAVYIFLAIKLFYIIPFSRISDLITKIIPS